MSKRQSWSTLVGLITNEPSAVTRVEQYISDPGRYFADHEDELAQRGIDRADEVRPIIVVIDALSSVGEVAYLDWKSPVDDVVELLTGLPLIGSSGVDLDVLIAMNEEADVEAVVGHANALLSVAGVAAVIVDEDSDAYPLVAVSTDAVDRLAEVAADLGVNVRAPLVERAQLAALLHDGASEENAEATSEPSPADGLRDRRVNATQLVAQIKSADRALKAYKRALPDAVRAGYGKHSRAGTAVPVELARRLRAGYASGTKLSVLAKQVAKAADTYAWTLETASPLMTDEEWAMYLTFDGNSELTLATIELLSWAVTLDNRDAVQSIITTAPVREANHPVIGHLAALAGFTVDVSDELPNPEFWESWLAVLDTDKAGRSTALADRVRTWPATTWKYWIVPPTDHRYSGQFCFDVAPLAACLNIDDTIARELPDYPADLVDFARERRGR